MKNNPNERKAKWMKVKITKRKKKKRKKESNQRIRE